jgi:hypothetical protein
MRSAHEQERDAQAQEGHRDIEHGASERYVTLDAVRARLGCVRRQGAVRTERQLTPMR